tara:strand:+ start:1271 stop:1453 length:183 start_codon:yes stop_codon:yes gene_type:complete
MLAPEPEPQCTQVIQLSMTAYVLMFFGAGVGWFCLGYFTLHFAGTRRRQPLVIAEVINQN